jgi:hypothetical protein
MFAPLKVDSGCQNLLLCVLFFPQQQFFFSLERCQADLQVILEQEITDVFVLNTPKELIR